MTSFSINYSPAIVCPKDIQTAVALLELLLYGSTVWRLCMLKLQNYVVSERFDSTAFVIYGRAMLNSLYTITAPT